MNRSLAELQSAFQAAILSDDLSVLEELARPPAGSVEEAFSVYEDAYGLRLHAFLSNAYPMLQKLVGEEAFADIAQSYIGTTPSTHRNARDYPAGLPGHMMEHCGFPSLWWEMAAFEQALEYAFDAMDQPAVTLHNLAEAAAHGPDKICLSMAASVRVLSFRHNVTAMWAALLTGDELPEEETFSTPKSVLVFRQGVQSRYRLLGEEEHMMLHLAQQHLSFPQMVEMLAFRIGPERAASEAASFLRNWISCGMVTSLLVSDA